VKLIQRQVAAQVASSLEQLQRTINDNPDKPAYRSANSLRLLHEGKLLERKCDMACSDIRGHGERS
jgi:hypothetical protein